MFEIASQSLDPVSLSEELRSDQAGARVVFEGIVRDHNEGRSVSSLEYEVYRGLAVSEGKVILAEARERFDLLNATAVHREGHLQIGDIAVWVGVISAHRDAAYKASRYIIDEIKRRLPIWKKEHYRDGEATWVNCQGCSSTQPKHFESTYYSRQRHLPGIADGGQKKLAEARVLVIGAGGLGVPVLTYLTAAGVGHITVCDK